MKILPAANILSPPTLPHFISHWTFSSSLLWLIRYSDYLVRIPFPTKMAKSILVYTKAYTFFIHREGNSFPINSAGAVATLSRRGLGVHWVLTSTISWPLSWRYKDGSPYPAELVIPLNCRKYGKLNVIVKAWMASLLIVALWQSTWRRVSSLSEMINRME